MGVSRDFWRLSGGGVGGVRVWFTVKICGKSLRKQGSGALITVGRASSLEPSWLIAYGEVAICWRMNILVRLFPVAIVGQECPTYVALRVV